ncbi:hypothetical protein AC1031_015029 [Aphanomyces cochlioides]|nr:hypothetical protein AC1031_015029 [Aphanomyces cochlioides]
MTKRGSDMASTQESKKPRKSDNAASTDFDTKTSMRRWAMILPKWQLSDGSMGRTLPTVEETVHDGDVPSSYTTLRWGDVLSLSFYTSELLVVDDASPAARILGLWSGQLIDTVIDDKGNLWSTHEERLAAVKQWSGYPIQLWLKKPHQPEPPCPFDLKLLKARWLIAVPAKRKNVTDAMETYDQKLLEPVATPHPYIQESTAIQDSLHNTLKLLRQHSNPAEAIIVKEANLEKEFEDLRQRLQDAEEQIAKGKENEEVLTEAAQYFQENAIADIQKIKNAKEDLNAANSMIVELKAALNEATENNAQMKQRIAKTEANSIEDIKTMNERLIKSEEQATDDGEEMMEKLLHMQEQAKNDVHVANTKIKELEDAAKEEYIVKSLHAPGILFPGSRDFMSLLVGKPTVAICSTLCQVLSKDENCRRPDVNIAMADDVPYLTVKDGSKTSVLVLHGQDPTKFAQKLNYNEDVVHTSPDATSTLFLLYAAVNAIMGQSYDVMNWQAPRISRFWMYNCVSHLKKCEALTQYYWIKESDGQEVPVFVLPTQKISSI